MGLARLYQAGYKAGFSVGVSGSRLQKGEQLIVTNTYCSTTSTLLVFAVHATNMSQAPDKNKGSVSHCISLPRSAVLQLASHVRQSMYANLCRVPELAHNDSSSAFHFPGNDHLLLPLTQSKCNLVILPKGSCRAGFAFVCMLTFHILDPGTPCSSLQTFQLQ